MPLVRPHVEATHIGDVVSELTKNAEDGVVAVSSNGPYGRRGKARRNGSNDAAKFIALGILGVVFSILLFHKCIPRLLGSAKVRNLAGSSSDDGADPFSGLDLLADVCSNVSPLDVNRAAAGELRQSSAVSVIVFGGRARQGEGSLTQNELEIQQEELLRLRAQTLGMLTQSSPGEMPGNVLVRADTESPFSSVHPVFEEHSYSSYSSITGDPATSSIASPPKRRRVDEHGSAQYHGQPYSSSLGKTDEQAGSFTTASEKHHRTNDNEDESATLPAGDEFWSERSLGNVPRISIPYRCILGIPSWNIRRLNLASLPCMSNSSKIAWFIHRKFSRSELSGVDIRAILRFAKSITSNLIPLNFVGEDARKPCNVASRVGISLFIVDALYRVTEMFPNVTHHVHWWGQMMNALNLQFTYSTFKRCTPTTEYIEDCRRALLMYAVRKRPPPAELHRLFKVLNQKYSRRKNARRNRQKKQNNPIPSNPCMLPTLVDPPSLNVSSTTPHA